jgi:predicted ATPase
MSSRFVIVSGCSSGGKSTLLAELARRGHGTIEEPGRRIVREELAAGGTALPWLDADAFIQRAIAMARDDRLRASTMVGWVFFDRGLIDAASALQDIHGGSVLADYGQHYRSHPQVFLTPPWPEIYVLDPERKHAFEEAVAEYDRLVRDYGTLGYEVVVLPKLQVEQRADFLLSRLPAELPNLR